MQEVKLVKIGLTMESGTIVKWYKSVGDLVTQGDPLFEVETDKATQTIESFHTGYLRKILVAEGTEIPVNTVIALIGEKDEQGPGG